MHVWGVYDGERGVASDAEGDKKKKIDVIAKIKNSLEYKRNIKALVWSLAFCWNTLHMKNIKKCTKGIRRGCMKIEYFNYALGMTVLLLTIVLVMITLIDSIQEKLWDTDTYHYGEKVKRRKYVKEKIPGYKTGICFLFSVESIILLQVWAIMFAKSGEIVTFWDAKIFDLPILMLSSFVTIITFLGIIRSFDKETYIFYSAKTLAQQILLSAKVRWMLGLVLGEFGLFLLYAFVKTLGGAEWISLLVVLLMLEVFAWYMLLLANLVWEFIDILFGYQNEHRLIKRLYQEFWYDDFATLTTRKIALEEKKNGILEILSFLVEEYCQAAQKVEFEKIGKVKYGTYLRRGNEIQKIARKKAGKLLFLCMFIYFLCAFVLQTWSATPISVWNESWKKTSGIVLGILLVIVVILYAIPRTRHNVWNSLISVFYSKKGYCVFYERKEVLVPEVTWFDNNKEWQFVISAKNLLVFLLMMKNADDIKDEIKEFWKQNKTKNDLALIFYLCSKLGVETVELEEINIDEKHKLFADAIFVDIQDIRVDEEEPEEKKKDIKKWKVKLDKIVTGVKENEIIKNAMEFAISVCLLVAVYWIGFELDDIRIVGICCLLIFVLLTLESALYYEDVGIVKTIWSTGKNVLWPMWSMQVSLLVCSILVRDNLSVALGLALDAGYQTIICMGVMVVYIVHVVAARGLLLVINWIKNKL